MRNDSSGVIETLQCCKQGHLYLAAVCVSHAEPEAPALSCHQLESC